MGADRMQCPGGREREADMGDDDLIVGPWRGRGTLGQRLALSFVAVAVLAIVLVTVLAVVFADRDVAALVQTRHDDLSTALATDAVKSYRDGPGWDEANLRPMLDLADSDGAQAAILNATGKVVASTLAPDSFAGVARQALEMNGRRVGTLLVRFTSQGLSASANNLRASLVGAMIGAAGLGAVLAVLGALLVSRWITRPVLALIDSARAIARGERRARVGELPGAAAELRELAAAFDHMADTITAEEKLHRDLVADVAHELRTPVAVLQANTEALLDGLVPQTPEQIASLHEEVLRLGQMVGDLQTLASAEAAALQLSLTPADLAEIAAAAAGDWEASFASAGIRFEQQLQSERVLADPGRLHQVIANLLSNALKFTPAGGLVRMTLSAAAGRARLAVSDTGPGIRPEDQPRVFDRLWRGHGAGTAGSGIGLAVAAELARAHHGTIELASEPGKGSRFTLVLPLAPAGG
jgi:two-component system, OmpR family, sensor histidine kinase BaeS